jgi:CO/xanthine dehydrogenase FAD-binding subunit
VKPARFDYAAPESLSEALELIGEEARPLAGGQSLIPMLNFRLARPELLVDLNSVSELRGMRVVDGVLRIGAMVRQVALEGSAEVEEGWPLLRQAVRYVGHAAIRSRGTVGGSVAHADPAAELAVALLALDARFEMRSARGSRVVAAGEFFRGPFTTALGFDELLTSVVVPPLPAGARCAFVEHARTHGDFAIAGAAVVLAAGRSAVALLGAGAVPVRAVEAERALAAGASAPEVGALAGQVAGHEYRRALIGELVRRAVVEAGGS